MLLASKITLLVQVYIVCLVNASSVFVNEYLHTNGAAAAADSNELSSADHLEPTAAVVKKSVHSKVLPEVVSGHQKQQQLFFPSHFSNQILFGGNSVVDDDDGPAPVDFESVTVSSSLLKHANDKNADDAELEEKIEMHTNNHNSPPLTTTAGQQQSAAEKNNHNTRHYSNAFHQTPAAKQQQHHYLSKYPHQQTNFLNSNLNLNYIHSLLLSAKPTASQLSNLLHGSSASSSQQQQQSYLNSQHYYSSSPVLSPATSNSKHSGGGLQEQQVNATTTILDLSSGSGSSPTVCGRQQVASGTREPRIVGGNNSYEGEFPWAVSIQRHGNHHCGGVIVGRRWILTAAHCVRSQLVANLVVRTGGNTLARSANSLNGHLERDYIVDQIVMHNDFSRYDNLTASQMKSSANTNNADIALLRLKHDIHWNELAWPVCFPPREAGNFSGHDAVVIGWGKLNEKSEEFSNELQKVKLTIIDNKLCQNWFRQAGREMPIDDRVICAGFKNGGKDACHGDSGGPLLSKINGHYAVVGVVSTGIGCARPLLPGLYSRVSSYIGWIERHISSSAGTS